MFRENVKGIKETNNPEQLIGLCPFHDDNHPSLSVNIKIGLWNCKSCGMSGNANQFTKGLSLENPKQYMSKVNNGHNKKTIPVNTGKKRSDDIAKNKSRYASQLSDEIKQKLYSTEYVGMDDTNRLTFHYPYGIKHHKGCNGENPYWEGDGHCQIFMEDRAKGYPTDKPIYIFEGEKDALVAPFNGISFSAGAGSIPKDITILYRHDTIIIVYDNDKTGKDGAIKLVSRIKKESPRTIVRIAKWNESLADGYDVWDEWKKTMTDKNYHYDELDEAIKNAVEYKFPNKGFEVIDMKTLMNKYNIPLIHIIENLLVEKSVTLVAGTDGVGKTWLVMQMAFCLASGKEFLGFKVEKRPVLLIQFELSPEQISERLIPFQKNFGFVNNKYLDFALLGKDSIFSDAWRKVENTIDENGMKDAVIIIDNIYASTDADVSNNHFMKPLLQKIHKIKTQTGNSIVLVGHHNKTDDGEPLLNKNIITGGKTLTNYVSNVFQMGDSSMGTDYRRAKITKVRDGHCDLLHQAFRLDWNPDKCLFTRGGIITNEMAHCKPKTNRWEYEVIIEFSEYESQRNAKDFDRHRLWEFLSTKDGWEKTSSNETKVTRLINRLKVWGLIIPKGYNKYELNWDEIAILNANE